MSCDFGVIGNPIITQYLDSFNTIIPREEIKVVNFDEMVNNNVSSGTLPPAYLPSNEVRKTSNFLYINSKSKCIPNDYSKKMYYKSLDQDEDYWMPLDYLLFTRSDGTHFLLAENISENENFKDLKSYSILRYSNVSGKFNESTIYSDGIDMARIKSRDQKYIDAIGDVLLSEKHIEESLLSVDQAQSYVGMDDVTFGAGYVGYLDNKSCEISHTIEGNMLRMLEKDVKEKGIALVDKTPIDALYYSLKRLAFRFKQLFVSKDASSVGVNSKGNIIPKIVLDKILKDAPTERIVELDNVENAERIELELEQEQESAPEQKIEEVPDQIQNSNIEKAKNGAKQFTGLAQMARAVEKGKLVPPEKNQEEIDK